MINYEQDIRNVLEVHGQTRPKSEIEEINRALNDLITDYMVNDGMTESDADSLISNDFWNYVKDTMQDDT